MNSRILFLALAWPAAALPASPVSQQIDSLRFAAAPVLQVFPDGSLDWSAAVGCPVPGRLSGARVVFSFDADLDRVADAPPDSSALSPADCEGGVAALRRTLYPAHPAALQAELRVPEGATTDVRRVLTGGKGSLLSIARFCARPRNGEPEWIELRNNGAVPVALAKVKLEGRSLSGSLDPGASLVAGSDTAELRLWQPAARLFAPSSWSSLRNTGDTLRLVRDDGLPLDSAVYGSAVSPLEACASTASELSSAASGFDLEIPSAPWNPRAGPLEVTVRAPAQGRYDLRVYDLDGVELCAPARDAAAGPVSLSLSSCPGMRGRGGPFLIWLQPRGAPGIRRLARIAKA